MPQAGRPSTTKTDRLEIIGRTLAALDAADARLDEETERGAASPSRELTIADESAEIIAAMTALRREAEWLVPKTPAGCLALVGVLLNAVDEACVDAYRQRRGEGTRRYERLMAHLIDGLAAVSGLPPGDLYAVLDTAPRRQRLDSLIRDVRRSAGDRSTGTNVVPFKAA